MTRFLTIAISLISLTLLAACAPVAAEDVAELVPTEINAPAFITDLLNAFAEEQQIDIKEIKLVSVEKVQWRDSCLGVERKGMMCLEVITPGYLIVFETPTGTYEAHTNEDGTAYIFVAQEKESTEIP